MSALLRVQMNLRRRLQLMFWSRVGALVVLSMLLVPIWDLDPETSPAEFLPLFAVVPYLLLVQRWIRHSRLDCSTTEKLARSFYNRSVWVVRAGLVLMALALMGVLAGWTAMGAGFILATFFSLLQNWPTKAAMRRSQAEIESQGCFLSISEAIRSTS